MYINVLTMSIFLMIFYTLYSSKKQSIFKIMASIIIISKFISMYYKSIQLNYICEIMIILFVILKNIKYKKFILASYFIYLPLSFFVKNIYILGSIIELISGICIFEETFKKYIVDILNQKNEILGKCKRSDIKTKMYYEKLTLNEKFSKTIYSNMEKKNKILDIILDQGKRGMILIDSQNYIINEDDGIYKMLRCKNLSNVKINEFLDENIKNADEFLKCIDKCREEMKTIENELKGKEDKFFSCTYSPIIMSKKEIGIICTIKDITYKRKSEIKIEENDLKYKKIVDNIPYSILLTNSEDILYNNEKHSYVNFYNEELKNIIVKPSTKGELYYFNEGEEICFNIDRVSFKEGEFDKNLVVIRDITREKMLLKQVERSKKKHEVLVNIIPEGIYISDYENKDITYANSKFLEMLGSDNIKPKLYENIAITSGSDVVKFTQHTLKNIYGENVYIESGAMLIDVNSKLKLVGIVRDITEQVKSEMIENEIEQRKMANKIKDEFFINMSHELKTPLNVIYLSNQLVESIYKNEIQKKPKSELSNAIKIINKHIYMLMPLIDNIMDLAKLESGVYSVEKDNYNIVDIIEDVVYEFNKRLDVNDIDIVFDTDEEEKIANIDPKDIEKTLLILLSFIIRYSNNKSVINVDLKNSKDETTIYIKNIGGYTNDRYINDKDKKNLDVGISMAKLIIALYNGEIKIVNKNEDIIVEINLKLDDNITDYKNRKESQTRDMLYADYIRMCNF